MDNVFIDFLNNSGGKTFPVSNSHRQAYSDRISLLMALLSKLAYTKFNPPPDLNKIIQENIRNTLSEKQPWLSKRKLSKMQSFFSLITYDHLKETEYLENTLNKIDLKLVKTFDSEGTQAILCSYNDEYLILAFRGTEKTNFADIKTDVNAIMRNCKTGGKVHSGFDKAYRIVHDDICKTLENLNNKPLLYITGHSLGGALAIIATKHLEPIYQNGIAACYTFGSPRVAGTTWISTIKTPIYRVVNAADSVTMLPPSWISISAIPGFMNFLYKYRQLSILIPIISESMNLLDTQRQRILWISTSIISRFMNLIPGSVVKNWKKALSEKYEGYLHAGDMRCLSSCNKENYDDVQLLPHVSLFWRLRNWSKSRLWTKFLGEHSIDIYCKKLLVIAKRRNP